MTSSLTDVLPSRERRATTSQARLHDLACGPEAEEAAYLWVSGTHRPRPRRPKARAWVFPVLPCVEGVVEPADTVLSGKASFPPGSGCGPTSATASCGP